MPRRDPRTSRPAHLQRPGGETLHLPILRAPRPVSVQKLALCGIREQLQTQKPQILMEQVKHTRVHRTVDLENVIIPRCPPQTGPQILVVPLLELLEARRLKPH